MKIYRNTGRRDNKSIRNIFSDKAATFITLRKKEGKGRVKEKEREMRVVNIFKLKAKHKGRIWNERTNVQ